MKQTICALVLGSSLLPLETEARPSKPKIDPINPEVRAIVEYVINNPTTTVNTKEVYAITAENCWQKGKQAGCRQSGTRNTYHYKFTLNGQEVTISYQDLDSTRIHSDGEIGPYDRLEMTQGIYSIRPPHSRVEFTDIGLDGKYDISLGVFPLEEIGPEENSVIQKEYESMLKEVGEYLSQHPLKDKHQLVK